MHNKVLVYLFIFTSTCLLSSCYAVRAIKYRKLNPMDHQKIPYLVISKSEKSKNYFESLKDNYIANTNWIDSQLNNTYTHAFLVIKNDSIVYEKYYDGFDKNTLLPSYSVAKSFVSTMISMAKDEGKIKSFQQPITEYIPQLIKNDSRFQNITIQHLLDMRSGIKWKEGEYGLKDDAIKMGFRPNILPYVYKIKIDTEPAKDSNYKSINTMLLGLIINKATGKTLVNYFEEKLWKQIGTENNATWNTDKHKLPITFGGLNATARDFAKLGSLYLHNGFWNDKQLITKEWVNASVSKDSMTKYAGYRNQFWGHTANEYFNDSTIAISKANGKKIKSYINKSGTKIFYFIPIRH